MTFDSDPRPAFVAAQDWVAGLLGGVRDEQWELSTPCPEFTVRELARHLIAVLDRAKIVAGGGEPMVAERFSPDLGDNGFAAEFADRLPALRAAWTDEALAADATVPPGVPATGAEGGWRYTGEILVHGWDIAVATGQPDEGPAEAVAALLERSASSLPAQPRGGFIPFDPPVQPEAGAGPTERLANWYGRRR